MERLNLRFCRTFLILLLGLFVSVGAFAQKISVTGVVKDQTGAPIIGGNIVVKGTTTGVITDVDGKFTLSANKGDVLVISYVGFTSQEVKADGKPLNIILHEDTELLDEVVVLGYGAQTRKQDLSASVGIVDNTDELAIRPVTSTESMLQGQLPGVTITSNGGDPTSTPNIVIRGQGSQNGDNVLWVVDGVPGAPISSMNDIESIVVLKDAASAAIYGAQSGAGGVILVTTKKAKEGAPSVSYDGVFGIRQASNLIEPLNAEQQLKMRQLSYANAGMSLPTGWDPERNPWITTTRTDWMDAIFRTAFYQRHNVALNVGTENFTNRVSFSYNNDQGVLINTYKKDVTMRYNGKIKLNKWVTVTEDFIWKNTDSRSKDTENDAYTGPILSAIYMPASATIRNPLDGTWGGVTTEDPDYIAKYGSNFADIHGDVVNPVRLLEAENRYNKTSDMWSTTTLEMLLTHTSGIVDGAGYNWAISQSVFPSLDQVLQYRNFSGSAPGKQYAYTNFGMGLVSAAIEYATGQPFRSYAQQVLFEPLGLDAGFLTDDIDDPQTIALLGSVDPLDWGKMEKAYARIPVGQMYLLGQGELYISAKDLARIAMILAGDGSFLPAGSDTRQTFLSAETLEEMHTPKVYDEATNTTRGLALQMTDEIVDGVTLWGHQGNAYGVISCLFYDRESHKGLAFLTSSASQMRAENKIYAVNDAAVRAVWEYLQ